MPVELTVHDTDHAYDPDPDCADCRASWDWVTEAISIVENPDSLLVPSREHLTALVDRLEQREGEILRLKELLREIPLSQLLSQPIINQINNALGEQVARTGE